MDDIVIEANQLSKKYQDKFAIQNCSFKVKRGQIVGLVGLNGAGKTTLIRILSGLVFPSSGSFTLLGVPNGKQLYKVLGRVSSMVEHPALYNDFTAVENMIFQCQLLGIKNPIESGYIKYKLKDVGLDYLYNSKKHVKDFSLGMKQRLGIALATLNEPEIMILDEPTNGLDPEGISEFRNLLIKINKENNTTIFVSSHILSELEKFATSYLFIDNGIIRKQIDSDKLELETSRVVSFKCDKKQEVISKLSQLGYTLKEDNEIIYVYSVKDINLILNTLVELGSKFSDFKEDKNDLEDYFMKLIGQTK